MDKLLMIVGLMCVAASSLEARRYSFPLKDDRFQFDEPMGPECEPECEEGYCCTAQLPLIRYVCVPTSKAGGKTCHEGPEKCDSCLVETVRKGKCSLTSSKRCFNPLRFAVSSNCCPEGKVCKASKRRPTSLFGSCRTAPSE